MKKKNLVLIGMPGVGKSTIGVLLAKDLSRPFVDTDIHIQTVEGRSLQTVILEEGIERFKAREASHILGLTCQGHVVATGGSVVYSPAAMKHLRTNGMTLLLELSLPLLEKRIRDMDARGIVRAPGQSLAVLYEERRPLYERYADIRISCDHKGHEEIIREIHACLEESTDF